MERGHHKRDFQKEKENLLNILRKIKIFNFLENKINSKYFILFVYLIYFIDVLFLVVPAELVSAIYFLNKKITSVFKILKDSLIFTIFAILGCIILYFIGFHFSDFVYSDSIQNSYLYEKILNIEVQDQAFFLFISTFLGLPATFVVFLAGYFKFKFIPFLLAMFSGRLIRYFLINLILVRSSQTIFSNKKLSRGFYTALILVVILYILKRIFF